MNRPPTPTDLLPLGDGRLMLATGGDLRWLCPSAPGSDLGLQELTLDIPGVVFIPSRVGHRALILSAPDPRTRMRRVWRAEAGDGSMGIEEIGEIKADLFDTHYDGAYWHVGCRRPFDDLEREDEVLSLDVSGKRLKVITRRSCGWLLDISHDRSGARFVFDRAGERRFEVRAPTNLELLNEGLCPPPLKGNYHCIEDPRFVAELEPPHCERSVFLYVQHPERAFLTDNTHSFEVDLPMPADTEFAVRPKIWGEGRVVAITSGMDSSMVTLIDVVEGKELAQADLGGPIAALRFHCGELAIGLEDGQIIVVDREGGHFRPCHSLSNAQSPAMML